MKHTYNNWSRKIFEGYDTSYHFNIYSAATEEIYNHLAVMEDTPQEVINVT